MGVPRTGRGAAGGTRGLVPGRPGVRPGRLPALVLVMPCSLLVRVANSVPPALSRRSDAVDPWVPRTRPRGGVEATYRIHHPRHSLARVVIHVADHGEPWRIGGTRPAPH